MSFHGETARLIFNEGVRRRKAEAEVLAATEAELEQLQREWKAEPTDLAGWAMRAEHMRLLALGLCRWKRDA